MILLAGNYDSIPPQDHKVHHYTDSKITFTMERKIRLISIKLNTTRVAM